MYYTNIISLEETQDVTSKNKQKTLKMQNITCCNCLKYSCAVGASCWLCKQKPNLSFQKYIGILVVSCFSGIKYISLIGQTATEAVNDIGTVVQDQNQQSTIFSGEIVQVFSYEVYRVAECATPKSFPEIVMLENVLNVKLLSNCC